MNLILKVSPVNTVRDSVLGHPLTILPVILPIIATLSSDFGYFCDLPKIHLDPLPFVTLLGYIGGAMVEPSFTGSKIRAPLPRRIT